MKKKWQENTQVFHPLVSYLEDISNPFRIKHSMGGGSVAECSPF